ncbi:hypothetical protein HK102_006281, partial [Quaeritorhiza haematococci]
MRDRVLATRYSKVPDSDVESKKSTALLIESYVANATAIITAGLCCGRRRKGDDVDRVDRADSAVVTTSQPGSPVVMDHPGVQNSAKVARERSSCTVDEGVRVCKDDEKDAIATSTSSRLSSGTDESITKPTESTQYLQEISFSDEAATVSEATNTPYKRSFPSIDLDNLLYPERSPESDSAEVVDKVDEVGESVVATPTVSEETSEESWLKIALRTPLPPDDLDEGSFSSTESNSTDGDGENPIDLRVSLANVSHNSHNEAHDQACDEAPVPDTTSNTITEGVIEYPAIENATELLSIFPPSLTSSSSPAKRHETSDMYNSYVSETATDTSNINNSPVSPVTSSGEEVTCVALTHPLPPDEVVEAAERTGPHYLDLQRTKLDKTNNTITENLTRSVDPDIQRKPTPPPSSPPFSAQTSTSDCSDNNSVSVDDIFTVALMTLFSDIHDLCDQEEQLSTVTTATSSSEILGASPAQGQHCEAIEAAGPSDDLFTLALSIPLPEDGAFDWEESADGTDSAEDYCSLSSTDCEDNHKNGTNNRTDSSSEFLGASQQTAVAAPSERMKVPDAKLASPNTTTDTRSARPAPPVVAGSEVASLGALKYRTKLWVGNLYPQSTQKDFEKLFGGF